MPFYQIVRIFEVERTFEVEAPSEDEALANTQDWQETDEITRDVITTEITEIEPD